VNISAYGLIVLGSIFAGTPCLAQTSAPSSTSITSPAPTSTTDPVTDDTAKIKRLFFSEEKRAALDRQRTQNLQQIRSLQGTTLNLDGLVQRSSGKSTVWINGQPQNENEAARNGVNVFLSRKSPGTAEIAPGDETPTAMKVGEVINRATGERDNRLGDGSVTTHDTRAKTAR
jgi:hypothetical protein